MQKLYIFKKKDDDYFWLTEKVKKFFDIEFVEVDLLEKNIYFYIEKKLEKESVVIGHSLEGLVAYKQSTPMKFGIYASPTPILDYSNEDKFDLMLEFLNINNIKDIQKMTYLKPEVDFIHVLFGSEESWKDMDKFDYRTVDGSGHILNDKYKEEIIKLLLGYAS